jgi:putative spermidine/putrescine transport system permease protein
MAEATPALLTTADGRPLKEALATAQARAKRRAFLLVLPLLLFVLLTFLVPIGYMLKRSFEHDGFASSSPAIVAWFKANADFDPANPPEEAYAALVQDLARMQVEKTTGLAGTRINYSVPGSISMFKAGARAAKDLAPPFKESLLAVDPDWGRPALWRGMQSASSVYTPEFYLVAADRKLTDDGWTRGDDGQRIYLYLFFKTFWVSAIITVLCLLLAFPVAHLLATLPMAKSSLLMILVLLPFWTSLLVRTTSWIALLQEQGIVNDLLVGVGLISDEGRLAMMYNLTGTIVAMTHVLLPFMILPLYSVMRVIPPSYARRAVARGDKLDDLPPGLPSADLAGDRSGVAARLHSGGRLLHHTGPGRRRGRAADFEPDQFPYDQVELVIGRSDCGNAAGGDPAAVLALRQADRHRPAEAGVRRTSWPFPPMPHHWNASGTTPTW